MSDEQKKPDVPDFVRGDSSPISEKEEEALDSMLRAGSRPAEIPTVTPKKAPAQILADQPTATKVASEVAGRPLTHEEALKMLNNLPESALEEFTQRVVSAIRQQKVAEEETRKAVPRYITDFSTIQERDIFNMDLPINPISHEIPDFLDAKLKDPNFVTRWIHTNSRRLGEVMAQGFTYVRTDELQENLKVDVTPDAAGHIVYSDVVLMKITKAKYYGRLRENFKRAMSMTQTPGRLHEKMKNAIESELASGPYSDDYKKYNKEGHMNTYTPLVGA